MNMYIRRSVVFGALLALAVALWAPVAAYAETAEQVEEVRNLLETYHLSHPDEELLRDGAIDGMIEALDDPYTEYFSPDEWTQFTDSLEQNFVGIGIVMTQGEDAVYIEDVFPDSPAEKAGLLPGDAIVSADGVSTRDMTVSELHDELLDVEGTTVELGVERNGRTLLFRVTRQALQVPTASARMMGDGVGYLSLTTFSTNAYEEFSSKLSSLEKNGLRALIVDLRNNGGGYVNEAQQIAGLFIEEGVLAHMRDRDGNDMPLTVSGGTKPYPVWVLVNANTASASELLAGALQDYGVAKLVGATTYGKGVVQSLLPVSGGGYLKVTVQEYYTPKDRKVDKVGLAPDIAVDGSAVQLITAFREAGGKEVRLVSGKGTVSVNGVRAPQPRAAYKHEAGWYVNSKVAGALAGAVVKYDAKTKSVVLIRGADKLTVKTSDARLHLQNGVSAIDVRLLQSAFPDVTWSASGNTITLQSSGASATASSAGSAA